MPDKIIQVDGLGQVAFPDTMSNDDIGKAIQTHLAKQGPKAAPAPASALDNLQGLASHAWSATSNAASSLAGKAADALGVKGESASDVVGDLFSSVLGGAPNTKNDRDQQQQGHARTRLNKLARLVTLHVMCSKLMRLQNKVLSRKAYKTMPLVYLNTLRP